jgi:hypothetical protein
MSSCQSKALGFEEKVHILCLFVYSWPVGSTFGIQ